MSGATEINLTLPFPPTVNTYWRRNGRRYFVTARGLAFRTAVRAELLLLRIARTEGPLSAACLEGPLSLVVELHPPDRRRRDIDNPLKALLDALQHAGAYRDDEQIDELTIRKFHKPVKGGRVEVKLRPIQPRES